MERERPFLDEDGQPPPGIWYARIDDRAGSPLILRPPGAIQDQCWSSAAIAAGA